jgi:predicted amidophosphoribosyltransferase
MMHDKSSIFEFAPGALVRTRKTTAQARSEKRTARIANLHEAFTCPDPTHIRGRTIILIDDVTTTGATLLSAKHALSLARPRKIIAFTVAH